MKKIVSVLIIIAIIVSLAVPVGATDGYHYWAYGGYDEVRDEVWAAGWAEIGYMPSYYIYITAELRMIGMGTLIAQDCGEGAGWATADTNKVWTIDYNYCYVDAPWWCELL